MYIKTNKMVGSCGLQLNQLLKYLELCNTFSVNFYIFENVIAYIMLHGKKKTSSKFTYYAFSKRYILLGKKYNHKQYIILYMRLTQLTDLKKSYFLSFELHGDLIRSKMIFRQNGWLLWIRNIKNCLKKILPNFSSKNPFSKKISNLAT